MSCTRRLQVRISVSKYLFPGLIHFMNRLILIAEKDTVYDKFPIPLINRLEKHFVLTRTVLLSWQERVLDALVKWVQQFSRTGK